MKYKDGKIIYETGDWVKCTYNPNVRKSLDFVPGKVFQITSVSNIGYVDYKPFEGKNVASGIWIESIEPATQSEIDAYIKSQKPEFKIGDWTHWREEWSCRNPTHLGRIYEIIHNKYHVILPDGTIKDGSKDYCLRLATKGEIESALMKEAERRGYKHYTQYKCAKDGNNATIQGTLRFTMDRDMITDGWGGAIYYDGKWAEIIVEDPPIMIGEHQATWDKGYEELKVGCKSYTRNQVVTLCRMMENLNIEQIQISGHKVSYFNVNQIVNRLDKRDRS